MKLEEIVNSVRNFTDSEKEILEYVLNNKETVVTLSSSELAEETFTSPATITRLSKKLGCAGFNELKYLINQDLARVGPSHETSNIQLLKNDISETFELIDQTDIRDIVDLLNNANRIYTYGTSWGERNALEMFTRNFMATNIHFIDIPSITEFQWIANEVTQDDLIIIISYSGENDVVLAIANNLQLRNIPTVSVTPMHENTLASMSTKNLYYAVTELSETRTTRSSEHNLFTTLHILLDTVYRSI